MDNKVRQIVAYLADSLERPYYGGSSMTTSVYDTAWVAMVAKPQADNDSNATRWLFPRSFQAILRKQMPDGGFGQYDTTVDQILNTSAALLAFLCHKANPSFIGCDPVPDMRERIRRGKDYLNNKLQTWNLEDTDHVGFEILVPKLLTMLQAEGLDLNFPGLQYLMLLKNRKLGTLSPAILYEQKKTTLLHSLEAFIGDIEFDKVGFHLTNGSMMASPSSTAAYLMNRSTWDDEAENYLDFVVSVGDGAVPSAFPINVFEITWVISTFLEAGLRPEALGQGHITRPSLFLKTELEKNSGILGFSPDVLPDVDDTAKSILCLNLLGLPFSCKKMIEVFEDRIHFRTYVSESTESFSANCNVLMALLTSPRSSQYVCQIEKALEFVCSKWYDGNWKDKWNLERQYSMMLLSQVAVTVFQKWGAQNPTCLSSRLLHERIPLMTLQIIIQTLSGQDAGGSWKNSPEITSYSVLTLRKLVGLPWMDHIRYKIEEAIDRGTNFINEEEINWGKPALVWVEKVTYGSAMLSSTYCLAAIQPSWPRTSEDKTREYFPGMGDKLRDYVRLFSALPILAKEPIWRLSSSILEGLMLTPILDKRRSELHIFPSRGNATPGYLQYIPFTWTMCNNSAHFGMSTKAIVEMMVVSMLNFEVDKYLEDVTADNPSSFLFDSLRITIRQVFDERHGHIGTSYYEREVKRRKLFTTEPLPTKVGAVDSPVSHRTNMSNVKGILSQFVSWVLEHPDVVYASKSIQRRLKDELVIFLLAHVAQGEDNFRLQKLDRSSRSAKGIMEVGTYFDWVRTTSANHTSCPYSFEFFRCVVSPPGVDYFSTARARYIGQDLCRHLATLCRQYNDYGSMDRDLLEQNLNSVDFPEFLDEQTGPTSEISMVDLARQRQIASKQLLEIALYERQCLELAVAQVQQDVKLRAWRSLQVFIKVTDIYGQIYIVKDINRNSGEGEKPNATVPSI